MLVVCNLNLWKVFRRLCTIRLQNRKYKYSNQ